MGMYSFGEEPFRCGSLSPFKYQQRLQCQLRLKLPVIFHPEILPLDAYRFAQLK